MSRLYRLIYITSPPHSGSTLLDYLLSSHSSFVGVGEVASLGVFANLQNKSRIPEVANKCACGAGSIWECSFWPRIDEEVKVLSEGEFGLKKLQLRSSDDAVFAKHNELLFDAIAKCTGAKAIVDSSKGLLRLERLTDVCNLDIRIIKLMRRPHGQVFSVLRRNPKLGIQAASVPYNRFVARAGGILRNRPHQFVRYEDLVANPVSEMGTVMRSLGFELEAQQLEFRSRDHHNIAGNRMRFSGKQNIQRDDDWRTRLRLGQKLAVTMHTLRSRVTGWATARHLPAALLNRSPSH